MGHTYDRASIEKWHKACTKTGAHDYRVRPKHNAHKT
ncbi:uncharacterized protein G2W53_022571 [Senna tora]|uniref:Uncharacterized protein n=1 Tax=Senna tora TaxID=362788 RepID=A0A834TMQ8_9FABA|nr:uncharacterized protein G2W53_022571 [Senna tora]